MRNKYVYIGDDRFGLEHGETYVIDANPWMGGIKVAIFSEDVEPPAMEYDTLDEFLGDWMYASHLSAPVEHITVQITMKSGKTFTVRDWTLDGKADWVDEGIFSKSLVHIVSPSGSCSLWIPVNEIMLVDVCKNSEFGEDI